ncbi:dephospho-CoA kinase [Desulfofustis limnaeus]|jgi:dephospho-CoA kinase|uniref:Dephospho-CoA kinase n=1 Tax=Desulfofustis limnaeus TaxID=2740163 RepID=A0ABM7W988_9BACT|nr:dephospho-CoA kinase [Desulfofustis limnaeus]MDX9895501.1 dephospho-CoA kinase [Desulfofustis sp.]BDD87531.1 dephospho-CoA kinase [Desulfofustis limnaeus]
MLIGVTGSIGTGKSTVATLLAEQLSAPLLSADQICRDLLVPGQPGYREFVATCGRDFVVTEGARIDRTRLRTALFTDTALRRQLERILHPLVREVLRQAHVDAGPDGVVVAEVPLLFECGWQDDFDYVICVEAPPALVNQRVARRDGVPEAQIEQIRGVQLPAEKKRLGSDWVINNDGDRAALVTQVSELAKKIKQ